MDIKIYANEIEESAKVQLDSLSTHPAFENSRIRIMPDVHAGAGCVIGFTATMTDKVVPNIVGVDIGCGMLTVKLPVTEINLEKLDKIINEKIPSGFNIHYNAPWEYDFSNIVCFNSLKDTYRFNGAIGTLGGGNHFIEIDKGKNGDLYLVIHSGSRNLGKQVADYYQKKTGEKGYLEGEDMEDYLNDMRKCQEYATQNRGMIVMIIMNELLGEGWVSKVDNKDIFETIHNYIDANNMIRKGAVSAETNELLLIPINMRDGSILARGKGNVDWNCSAPHGAGRIMGRMEAKRKLNIEDFKKSMEGIYTTSVSDNTIDEAPMAYKSLETIINSGIEETIEILDILKPIYNFKAKEE